MQERYTKQAENVLALAKEAASSCGHSYIGTEHLLVGLVEEKEGTAGTETGIQSENQKSSGGCICRSRIHAF